MDTDRAIYDYLHVMEWIPERFRPADVSFLAAGEYNENYLIKAEDKRYVFRINHGSQLGLKDQITYEYTVLDALKDSGVTPRPFFMDQEPGNICLGDGVLLMEYHDGAPLKYETESETAAKIFAAVHSQPVHDDLVKQPQPVADIAAESLGLINRFPDHPMQKERDCLLNYHEHILKLAEKTSDFFATEAPVIVNTEVNSGNFLIRDADTLDGSLVDWEKAVVSSRYQDLGHFLVPTTTRWKTDYAFPSKERMDFLESYAKYSQLDVPLDELDRKTAIMEETILLRALAWCYMAYYEYTRPGRALTNKDTFRTIKQYLNDMSSIINSGCSK